jgi:RNA polymerase Rpb2, domain 6
MCKRALDTSSDELSRKLTTNDHINSTEINTYSLDNDDMLFNEQYKSVLEERIKIFDMDMYSFGEPRGHKKGSKAYFANQMIESQDIMQSTELKPNESSHLNHMEFNLYGDKLSSRAGQMGINGDKLSSRAGQMGTIGMKISSSDIPYSKDGLLPDIVINPNCLIR